VRPDLGDIRDEYGTIPAQNPEWHECRPEVGQLSACTAALARPLGASSACPLAADHPSFLLGEPAPDARVLVGVEGELEALGANLALTAHLPRLFELEQGEAGGADREEQFRVCVATQGLVPPRMVGRSQGEA
jgi:hypothetical protein